MSSGDSIFGMDQSQKAWRRPFTDQHFLPKIMPTHFQPVIMIYHVRKAKIHKPNRDMELIFPSNDNGEVKVVQMFLFSSFSIPLAFLLPYLVPSWSLGPSFTFPLFTCCAKFPPLSTYDFRRIPKCGFR